jgi:hypothetical protein
VIGEQLQVLVEEAVTHVWIDPEAGVREVLGKQATVLGGFHDIVVAVGDEG